MAPVTLPPSFYNSFWSPDYRTGLEVLFNNLERGVLEDDDIADFIDSQVKGHHALANILLEPPLSSSSNQTSSSLQHTLLSLRGASSARGEAHKSLAQELESRVLAGFSQWKERHEVRVRAARDELLSKSGVVGVWEKDVQRLNSLRQSYQVKMRSADESEDDAKFAPATSSASVSSPDTYTSSPKPAHAKLANSGLRRAGTVADRINEKLRQAQLQKSPPPVPKPLTIEGKVLPPPPSPPSGVAGRGGLGGNLPSPTKEEAFIPPSEPDGKPTIQGPTPPSKQPNRMQTVSLDTPVDTKNPTLPAPAPVLLSGLSLSPQAMRDLLHRFDAYLLTNPAPYSDASVSAQPQRSNAALASRQRSSILGPYEKTFSGEEAVQWLRDNMEGFGGDWERCVEAAGELYKLGHFSRVGVGRGFEAHYDTYYTLKQQNSNGSGHNSVPSFGSIGSSMPSPSGANIQSMLKSYLPAGLGNSDEPAHLRLRREATKADEAYREGVKAAEEKRLEMEERIERGMRIWERWERERLSIVKSVLKQYDEALARLPSRLSDLISSTTLSVEAFNPEADLKALIEGNRTGPFRPQAHTYESVESDIPEVNFGIDLRRWSGEYGWKGMLNAPKRPRGSIPDILQALLGSLEDMYQALPEEERRRSWIYEVPLHETHALRNSVNASRASLEESKDMIKRFNVPVVAGVVKLYLLELNPPVLGWEGWEDAKAVYPSIGADLERDVKSALTSVLGRLPGIQLFVLDAVVKHFKDLIESTKSGEANEVYVTKLALSVGRCILRPQYETDVTIGDRTPSLFLADMINNYSALFPPLVEKKKQESERAMPIRKRTALVDQRISRSQLDGASDPQQLLELQHALANPSKTASAPSSIERSNMLGLGASTVEEPVQQKERAEAPKTADPAVPPQTQPILQPPPSEEAPTFQRSVSPEEPIFERPVSPEEPPFERPVSPDEPPFERPVSPDEPPFKRPVSPDEPPFQPPIDRSRGSDRVASPAPSIPSSFRDRPRSGAATPREDDIDSSTASILDSMDQSAPADEQPLSGGLGGLKRNTSAEVSRLRGPRGARGPRPAPGRVMSGQGIPPSASVPEPQPEATPAENERSGGVGVPGDYAPRRGKGATSAGAFGHKPKGSISALMAQFEGRG